MLKKVKMWPNRPRSPRDRPEPADLQPNWRIVKPKPIPPLNKMSGMIGRPSEPITPVHPMGQHYHLCLLLRITNHPLWSVIL